MIFNCFLGFSHSCFYFSNKKISQLKVYRQVSIFYYILMSSTLTGQEDIGICNSVLIEDEHYGEQMTFPGVWESDSVLTISNEPENYQFDVSSKKFSKTQKSVANLPDHVIVYILLLLSIIVFVTCYLLLNLYERKSWNHNVWNALQIFRFMGLFSFSGVLSLLVGIYIAFGITSCVLRKHRWLTAKDTLKSFLIQKLFNETKLKTYLMRAKAINENESGEMYVRFLESQKMDDLINKYLQSIYDSSEGIILESLQLERQSLKMHAKSVLLDVMILFFQQVPLSPTSQACYNSTFFKHHIERFIEEQLSYNVQVNTMFKEVMYQHLNMLSIIIWVVCVILGACVGSMNLTLD